MRAIIALIVIVYLVGVGVVLAPTIQAKWNGASASDLATSVGQALPTRSRGRQGLPQHDWPRLTAFDGAADGNPGRTDLAREHGASRLDRPPIRRRPCCFLSPGQSAILRRVDLRRFRTPRLGPPADQ